MLSDSKGKNVSDWMIQTDARGRCARIAYTTGPIRVFAEHESFGHGTTTIEPAPGTTVIAEVDLDPGVPCRGSIELPASAVSLEAECEFRLWFARTEGGPRPTTCRVTPRDGRAEFEVVGLAPGTYRVRWETTSGPRPIEPKPIDFELGAAGATDLVLRFPD